jgi:L-ribulose-5-phosphate 4-epimerase
MEFFYHKQEVFKITLDLVKIGLIRLSSGNISLRLPDGNVAITPSAVLYADMRPEDIVIIDLNGKTIEGSHKPSSEKSLHLALYHSRPDIHAVVHTHSVYSIAFSSVVMELPLICLELISVGGPVPVAEYCCPGTEKVGKVGAKFFTARPQLKGLLLKNHGLVAVGMNLQEAYQNAYNVETGAEIYHLALQTGKTPNALSDKEVQELLDTYNRHKS